MACFCRPGIHFVEYQPFFKNKTKKFFDKAVLISMGIIQSNMRNRELINEVLGIDFNQLQHLISDSPCYFRTIIGKVANEVSRFLRSGKLMVLIIDERGMVRKRLCRT